MSMDEVEFSRNCPECTIVKGGSHQHKPPLYLIPVQHPFQIMEMDVMDLPLTEQGNRNVVVFQDFFTKWPAVFPLLDQKAV